MDYKIIRKCHGHNGKKHNTIRGVNIFFNIPLTSISSHINWKTRFIKVRPHVVLSKEEEIFVDWIFGMYQAHGLSITL
jgi:hypothetical protein